ncbi:homoserine kinase [Acidomonas methanolica]|uniref:homoserine kinase n=1 Tax=Acidomonas methanolica TaxID=437 RepID=UPI00211A12BA|nr:homoserine kinase [Acidomonas methanolica]MCQ9155795.1 homoserine kinase [Acidomonas methanolica]
MAVYTTFDDAALTAFLTQYDIGAALACEGIAEGVENSNYLLDTAAGRYILTLYERRVREADLPWFLGYMRHLAARGVVCPTPVARRDGTLLGRLGGRPAALTTFLPGRPVAVIDAESCHQLGETLARLHAAGGDFGPARENEFGHGAWGSLLDACHGAGDALQAGLTDRVSAAIAAVEAAWPQDLPAGQIHADLFPDNAFFRDGRLSGVIDFYFACTDAFAYDLAICLNAWCFPDEATLDPVLMRAVLAGYESVRPLDAAERDAMLLLCRGAALRFLLTRLYDWVNTPPDAVVTRKDPLAYERRLAAWERRDEF